MMKVISNILIGGTFFFAAVCFAVKNPEQLGGVSVESSFKPLSDVMLPLSAIYYKEANEKNERSGFIADQSMVVTGSVRTYLIDYPRGTSSVQIVKRYTDTLALDGFTVLFNCAAAKCGKKDGYRLFFSNRLNDTTASQHYVVASRNGIYKALYLSDIDNQPRAFIVNIVETNNKKTANDNLIYFSTGVYELDAIAKASADKWILKLSKNTTSISVFGNADAEGGILKNVALAEKRAEAVKAYLLDKHVFSAEKIITLSAANVARPISSDRGKVVELMAHYVD
jgi:outer membrane protein OmpA-like peptidoglycan-associated protein